ncbi:hypothetical protein [Elizabethkingia meningoseptica]|uniref:hypothetical protein n=1 Tax=Elizabethkingia meningoseptica TaxID=238 RepID=UPI0023AF3A2D|nr:hypothetical protein [Elizabethkingia meningoseptica]MDE5492785.1 hypothetical protein [Elizabethkingia meningoseptica]
MKFEVYADRELLETILLESNRYENWNNILKHHSDVYVNMSQNDYDTDIALVEESILFQYLQDTGGKEPIPNEQFFIDFEADNSIVENRPLSTFFFNKKDVEINSLKKQFGLLFQNEKINDTILSKKFQKNCNKNDVYNNAGLIGWKAIMPIPDFCYNSLIITDPHLFNNDKLINGVTINFGVENIINFLDLILPKNLGVDFHLLIVSSRQNSGLSEPKMQSIYNDLNARISVLRLFSIKLELVITPDTIHRRNSYSNYHLMNCDKGFKIFSVDDPSKVQDDNNFKYFDIFEITNPNFGDAHYKELIEEVPKIKSGVNTSLNTIRAIGGNLEDKKCYGLAVGNVIQNRLINHFP